MSAGLGPQLAKLAKPFPAAYVEKPPQGKYGSYVAHHTITQAVLATLGAFDFELVEILRAAVPARIKKETGEVVKGPLASAVVGGVWRLSVTIDGRPTRIEEVGDCEDPLNWATDGARLKDAASDALKRCAMRAGLGLHLWSQEHYFLDKSLARYAEGGEDSKPASNEGAPLGDESGPSPRADRAGTAGASQPDSSRPPQSSSGPNQATRTTEMEEPGRGSEQPAPPPEPAPASSVSEPGWDAPSDPDSYERAAWLLRSAPGEWTPTLEDVADCSDPREARWVLLRVASEIVYSQRWSDTRLRHVLGYGGRKKASAAEQMLTLDLAALRTAVDLMEQASKTEATT